VLQKKTGDGWWKIIRWERNDSPFDGRKCGKGIIFRDKGHTYCRRPKKKIRKERGKKTNKKKLEREGSEKTRPRARIKSTKTSTHQKSPSV